MDEISSLIQIPAGSSPTTQEPMTGYTTSLFNHAVVSGDSKAGNGE